MITYTNCKTVKTGLYKPHTIYVNDIGISIVYYSKNNINKHDELIAIATDTKNNQYEIYRTKNIYGNTGYLAFPVNANNIPGIYPYL